MRGLSTVQRPRLTRVMRQGRHPNTSKPAAHPFWDRTNLLLFPGIAVTRGFDYASTRNFQARGRQEILLPDEVVNNSAGFASLEAAATMTSIGVSYLLHRTGHHTLERWMSIGHIGVTAFGDIRNYSLESRRRRNRQQAGFCDHDSAGRGRPRPHYHLRVPKYFRTPMVLYLPHGPLLPRSAGPRLRSRAPNRSNKKCWVTRNSNPLAR